jgi:hypothetical protein
MARPVGSTSHWWTKRFRVGLYLYNPTQEGIELLKKTAQMLNASAKLKATGDAQ